MFGIDEVIVFSYHSHATVEFYSENLILHVFIALTTHS